MWVWIQPSDGDTERRPAVVIALLGDRLELVYGQEKPWAKCTCPVLVPKASDFGKLFPLKKDTYFSAWQVTWLKLVDESLEHTCPTSYVSRIEAVAVEAKLRMDRRRAATAAGQAHLKTKHDTATVATEPQEKNAGHETPNADAGGDSGKSPSDH